MIAEESVLAWHWCQHNRLLGFDDDRSVYTGGVYEVDGPIVLCKHGLHGCRTALQALYYASGDVICRVRLSGEIWEDPEKLAASRREVLWLADGGPTLHRFAVWCAEPALSRMARGETVDPRLREALAMKLRWVDGLASDEELAAAWAAARDAERNAAWNELWNEARDAPWRVARAAAWAGAWTGAWTGAWAAVRAAAGNAGKAGDAWDAAWDAVSEVAWNAAWNAAKAAQSEELERRLLALAPAQTAHDSATDAG